jgi:hypothetical protein
MPTALGAAHFTDSLSTNRCTRAYHLAAVLAIEGNRRDAFSELQYSVENGLPAKIRSGIENDADFKSLHVDPRFALLPASSSQKPPAQQQPK